MALWLVGLTLLGAACNRAPDYAFTENDLSALKSYRQRQTISVQEEEQAAEVVETLLESVREPAAQHLTITSGANSVEVIRIGAESYARTAQGWIAMQIPDTDILPALFKSYAPESVFRGAKGRYVGEEMVNGQATKHYTFDKKALNSSGLFSSLTEGKGDVWVATSRNLMVRAVAQLKGKDAESGQTVTLELSSDLTDLDAEILIKPPEGVEKAQSPGDLPIMPGATNQVAIMGMVSYKVAATVEQVSAFYKAEMPKQGWKSVAATIPGFLAFEKDGRQAQVAIVTRDSITAVAIVLK
jgi:hypothetical protein